MDSRPHAATDAPIDPLDEPGYVASVYAAWAGASALLSPAIGLAVLVAATTVLAVAAVRADHAPLARSFMTDFGIILLFCCAAIAFGVLTVWGVTRVPALLVGAACLTAAALLVSWALQPDDAGPTPATPSTWDPAPVASAVPQRGPQLGEDTTRSWNRSGSSR